MAWAPANSEAVEADLEPLSRMTMPFLLPRVILYKSPPVEIDSFHIGPEIQGLNTAGTSVQLSTQTTLA